LREIGLKKVWHQPKQDAGHRFTYQELVEAGARGKFYGHTFDVGHFVTICITCLMISLISLQTEIYNSTGYIKFVTQNDGSMDLLVKLSELKQKSLTYMFNNDKIRKIIAIQTKKSIIESTVEKLKERLRRWRQFQTTTLTLEPKTKTVRTQDGSSPSDKDKDETASDRSARGRQQSWPSQEGQPQSPGDDGQDSILADLSPAQRRSSSKLTGRSGEPSGDAPGGKRKKVHFSADVKQQEEVKQKKDARKKKVSPEEAEMIYEKLAKEIVASKKDKLSRTARCYLCLNSCCINNLMIKNEKKELQDLVESHARGDMAVPCELEKIMKTEVKQLIKKTYDKTSGAEDLHLLLQKS